MKGLILAATGATVGLMQLYAWSQAPVLPVQRVVKVIEIHPGGPPVEYLEARPQ